MVQTDRGLGRVLLKARTDPNTRRGIFLLSAVVFPLSFLLVYLSGWADFFAINFIPVILIAWVGGWKVGLMAGVVPASLTFLLGVIMGVPIPILTVDVVTYAFMMGLCGGTFGLVSTLFGEVVTTQRELKLLQNSLPICSHCHRIRMENQEWIRLEAFFHDHSDTQLSHGICPICLEDNFPEEFEAMRS